MPIKIACPTCHARLIAPDAAFGKRAKCPSCKSTVPLASCSDVSVPSDPADPTSIEPLPELERPIDRPLGPPIPPFVATAIYVAASSAVLLTLVIAVRLLSLATLGPSSDTGTSSDLTQGAERGIPAGRGDAESRTANDWTPGLGDNCVVEAPDVLSVNPGKYSSQGGRVYFIALDYFALERLLKYAAAKDERGFFDLLHEHRLAWSTSKKIAVRVLALNKGNGLAEVRITTGTGTGRSLVSERSILQVARWCTAGRRKL